jgi:hypothetical protein
LAFCKSTFNEEIASFFFCIICDNIPVLNLCSLYTCILCEISYFFSFILCNI